MSQGVGIRLHRFQNIYRRTKSLILSGMVKHEKRPLWYDVYEAFPPVKEPRYVPEPESNQYGLSKFEDDVRKIYYKEDWVRAVFRKNKIDETPGYIQYRIVSLFDNNLTSASFSHRFIKQFKEFQDLNKDLTREELFEKTHDFFLPTEDHEDIINEHNYSDPCVQ